ncbi:MAG TPA: hypothetical protein VF647_21895 [Longimicrobium sp.]|jgi:hypothetical protein
MANLFAALGFDIETREQFSAHSLMVAEAGERIALPGGGEYRRWSPGAGVELWAQVTANQVVGMNPHFAGDTTIRAGVSRRFRDPAFSALDGMYQVWPEPTSHDAESGSTTFAIDAPDFALHDRVRLPRIAPVQVAAFAFELSAFANEEEYMASQTGQLKYASESLLPTGLFAPDGGEATVPAPEAMLSGRVLAAELRINPATGNPFRWARVRTWGGEIDVVAEPCLISGELVEGGIVRGSFWLTGRVCFENAEPRPPWWRLILRR